MEQRDETNRAEYPRGRGYGHDYMRGGEVFGGYGYSERAEYVRPRGAQEEEGDGDGDRTAGEDAGSAVATDAEEEPIERVPRAAEDRRDGRWAEPKTDSETSLDEESPPVPHLEHIFGVSGPRFLSRSFYVTQAQLQQRIYGPKRRAGGPYDSRLRTLDRPDDALKRDVEETLFYDTWVDAECISVEVNDGVVVLRGTLPHDEEIRFACDDAWEVAGVRAVHSELSVERPS